MYEFFNLNAHYIFMILFLISEVLGSSEKFKSNSIFDFIRKFLKKEALDSKEKIDKLFHDSHVEK